MSNPAQSAFSPVVGALNASYTQRNQSFWISKKKALCWKCQKDVPKSEGQFSFLISTARGRINSGNAPKKFICFNCKPKEQL